MSRRDKFRVWPGNGIFSTVDVLAFERWLKRNYRGSLTFLYRGTNLVLAEGERTVATFTPGTVVTVLADGTTPQEHTPCTPS